MISRRMTEIVTAGATGIVGLVAVIGSLELGVGWTSSGPEAGYFPFWIGLILAGASIWNGVKACLLTQTGEEAEEVFLSREQGMRILSFLAPMAVFVVITTFLGTYVGSTLYLVYTAHRQGGLSLPRSVLLGLGFTIALYLVFEMIFQVPLHKGPLEDMLGIY